MSNVNYVSHENLEYFKGKIEALIPTETTVSNWGFTKNEGTITGIKMNGASKGTSGVVDLGTVITSLSGYATETWVGEQGYITGITSTMVTDALGYTPPTQDTWRPLGTGSTDACAGDDARLSDSRPANGGTSTYASYLVPQANVTSYGQSTWDPTGSKKIIWGEAFINTGISSDSGDLTLFLRGASGGTELCMNIDGDYYSMGRRIAYASEIPNISGKLNKVGDSMSGTLTFDKVTNAIAYTGTKQTYNMIKFIDNTTDVNGNGIAIGGGGKVVVGSGESSNLYSDNGGDEVLYLTSDSTIYFKSNCQSGDASSKTMSYDTGGCLNVDKIYIKTQHNSSSWAGGIYGKLNTNDYLLIGYGSSNLWIGANETAGTHHSGATYISTGSSERLKASALINGARTNKDIAYTSDIPSVPSGSSLWNNGSTTWDPGNNVTCSGTGEWSFDCNGDTSSNMWHVWSAKNGTSILICYPYNNNVEVPNGNLTVKGKSVIRTSSWDGTTLSVVD